MKSVSTWRRRCEVAEARALTAERSAKRSKSRLDYVNSLLEDACKELARLRQVETQADRTLRSLAKAQLGEGATADEVFALVARWHAATTKRHQAEKEQAMKTLFEDMRRMGTSWFLGGGEPE